MDRTLRAAFAEFIGTFGFFTIGMGAVVVSKFDDSPVGLLGIAFAHGIALSVMISIFGRISGGHFNPAVTFGLWVGGKIAGLEAAIYWAAQLLAGVASGFFLRLVFAPDQWQAAKLGVPELASGVQPGTGLVVEAVLTAFLLLAIWGTAVDPKGPKVAGFAIGLTVFADILFGGLLTGAAMNPARAFGPALAGGYWADHWVYWAGPLAGASIASIIYRGVFYSGGMGE